MTPVESRLSLRRLPMRGRMDIMASILHEARDGAKKTRIMYRCNLSFRQMKVYLNLLVEKKLLEVASFNQGNSIAKVYKTTKEGFVYLKTYDKLKEISGEKGLKL